MTVFCFEKVSLLKTQLDASLHVTNGGFNPVLTVMALAFRVADHLVRVW